MFCFYLQITLNATSSVDEDYANITEANPEYYWFCRNSSDPEINTNGNLSAMPFVLVPKEYSGEVICDGSLVTGNRLPNKQRAAILMSLFKRNCFLSLFVFLLHMYNNVLRFFTDSSSLVGYAAHSQDASWKWVHVPCVRSFH